MSKKTLNHANLSALGADRLADLLLEVSTGSADIKRRLRLELSHDIGPTELGRDVRKRLVTLRRSTSFVGWRKRKALIKDLQTLVDMIIGKIGAQLNTQEGYDAARTCAINLLAQVKIACDGDLDLLDRVVKLTGFVNSTPDFTEQPTVINGASDFLVEVLGESGRHARSAVSAGALPLGVAVEVEGIFQLK